MESLSTLEVVHTIQLTNRVDTLSIQLATLSGASGLTLDELGDLPTPEVQHSVAATVEQVLWECLVEAVQTMPPNRCQSLNSALGSRGNGNGGSAVIPAGRTTLFPRKVRTDGACKLRPGMPPREAKTYLDNVREYLTLPQHVEYKNDMQFIWMIATSSMSAKALMMFRAAADPQQVDPDALIMGFGWFSAWVLSTFVYAVPSHLLRDDYECCVQRARESLDDFFTYFSATVMDMDYKPSEQEQSSRFLRNSSLNVALKQRLESDVALEFYPTPVNTYRAARAVYAIPSPSSMVRGSRGGYGRGRATSRGRAAPAARRRAAIRGQGTAARCAVVNAVAEGELVCWHCGQPGHRHSDCPELGHMNVHGDDTENAHSDLESGECNSAGCRAPFLPHKMLYSLEYIFPLEICLLFSPMDLKWGFSGNLGLPGGWPYSWLSNHLFCGYKYLSMLSLCDFFL